MFWRVCAGTYCLLLVAFYVYTSHYAFFHFDERERAADNTTRVVLIADPQIDGLRRVRRQGIYGHVNNMLNDWLQQWTAQSVWRYVRPDLAVVLGDLFHCQSLREHSWQHIYERYVASYCAWHNTPMLNVSGNHDLGYGSELYEMPVRRWRKHFGELNSMHEYGKHLFVVLNSLVLDGARDAALHEQAWQFVERVKLHSAARQLNVVLLLHLPLFKPANSCAGDTEPKMQFDWNNGGGALFQSVLRSNTTELLLEKLKPVLAFSGHDHEGCVYEHRLPSGHKTTEHTFRAAQGFYESNLGALSIHEHRNTPNSTTSFTYQVHRIGFWHTNTFVAFVIVAWVTVIAILSLIFVFL